MTNQVSAGVYGKEINNSYIVPTSANSIGAIVVSADKGPVGKPVLVTSPKQFLDTFGSPSASHPSMYAALAFLKQANLLYVSRAHADASTSTVVFNDSLGEAVVTIKAASPGAWANSVWITLSNFANANADFTINVFEGVDVLVEQFRVSRDAKKDGFGRSMYIEDVVNGASNYIEVEDSVNASQIDTTDITTVTEQSLTGGANDTIAPDSSAINMAWDVFADADRVDVTLLINAGWAAEAVQSHMISIAEKRTDCFAILDNPVTQGTPGMIDWTQTTLNVDTSFAAIYAGWPKIYDQFTGANIETPPSGDVAGSYAYTASNSEVWAAPAGPVNGRLVGALGISHVFTEGERDALYAANVNPIQSFPGGEGIQIYGQKTLARNASALDRVNVRMLMIQIQRDLKRALKPFVFQFNDEFTRANIKSIFDNYLEDIRLRRGLYDFLVVCDDSNNTATVVDRNQLIVDCYVKPVRIAEFITLNSIITATGASFRVN